jgi:hypothetical protein
MKYERTNSRQTMTVPLLLSMLPLLSGIPMSLTPDNTGTETTIKMFKEYISLNQTGSALLLYLSIISTCRKCLQHLYIFHLIGISCPGVILISKKPFLIHCSWLSTVYLNWNYGSRRVWPIDRGCFLLLGTWSYVWYIHSSVFAQFSNMGCLQDYLCYLPGW